MFHSIQYRNGWLAASDLFYVFINRSSHQKCSVKKGVLENFTKFAGKHLFQILFFTKQLWTTTSESIKFYTFHNQYRCLKNVIHQIDSKNGWLLLSAGFTAKFELVFVLTLENAFS